MCLTPQDPVNAAIRSSQCIRGESGAHCAGMWQGGAAVQQLHSSGGNPQARVQVLAQDGHGHGPGHAQVGLLQDPLPGADILALHGAGGYEPPQARRRLEAFQGAAVRVQPWCPPGTAADQGQLPTQCLTPALGLAYRSIQRCHSPTLASLGSHVISLRCRQD